MQREDVGDPSGTSLHSVLLPQNAVERRKTQFRLCAAASCLTIADRRPVIVAQRQALHGLSIVTLQAPRVHTSFVVCATVALDPSTLSTLDPYTPTPRREPLDPYTQPPLRNPSTQTLDPLRNRSVVTGLDPYTPKPRPLYAKPSTPRRFTLDPLRTGLYIMDFDHGSMKIIRRV